MTTGKAPGKYFRTGLSMREITSMFPDDATAEAWFVETRWPDGVTCPACGSVSVTARRTRKPQPYRCRDCRKDFSPKTGTLMHSSPLGYQIWAFALYLLTTNLKGISSMKLRRELGVTQKTAWYLAHRIRETWEDAEIFEGPVEIDETYVGGKRRNMHAKKRREQAKGRGYVGKTAVLGARDRATNKVRVEVRMDPEKQTFRWFVRRTVEPGGTLYTDGDPSYRNMPGYEHEAVSHSTGEYVRLMAHTNGIESFWATLKRAHKGTYHMMSFRHLRRYTREFAGRHNDRCSDTLDQMRAMVHGLTGKRLPYATLMAGAGK